jgi:hypothetical protein
VLVLFGLFVERLNDDGAAFWLLVAFSIFFLFIVAAAAAAAVAAIRLLYRSLCVFGFDTLLYVIHAQRIKVVLDGGNFLSLLLVLFSAASAADNNNDMTWLDMTHTHRVCWQWKWC